MKFTIRFKLNLLSKEHLQNCIYLPLFVYIAAIHCLEQQILCDICVDENSHKCTICHHKLKTNNFALKTYHVIVDSNSLQQQISFFIKAHQPMFLTFTAPHLTYL
jgi:hypothetical protein